MKIGLASDHGGYNLKSEIIKLSKRKRNRMYRLWTR